MHQQFFRKIIQASLQGVLRRLKCSFSMSKKSQMLFSSVMLNFVLNFPSAVSWHKLYDMCVIRCRSCRLLNTASFLHEMSHSSSFVCSSFKTFPSYFPAEQYRSKSRVSLLLPLGEKNMLRFAATES